MASQQTEGVGAWNPWRTVAMESFVDHWKEAPESEETGEDMKDAWEQMPAPELEDQAGSVVEEGGEDEDWVVVEKPAEKKSHWTRTMTDTEFNRVFQQPLPHNYGRANTNPNAEENYLKTFNVKAEKKEVYDNTLSFMSIRQAQQEMSKAQEKPKMPMESTGSAITPRKKQRTVGKQEQPQPITAPKNNTSDKPRRSRPSDVGPVLSRGNPSLFFYKVTQEEEREKHDMFDVLTWPEPESAEQVGLLSKWPVRVRPTPSSLDPRNYAYMDPSCTKLITPAGVRSLHSEKRFTVYSAGSR